jgi:hypothetical protein
LTSKEDHHHRDRDHRGDRDRDPYRPSSSTPASLSAGSTASIDSFVPVFGGLEDDGGGGADGPSWLRPEKNGAPSRLSSSSPPDPYLSDRRRPSWARDADAPLLSPLSSAQPEGAAAGGGAPAAAAPRGTAAAASFSRLAEDGGLAFRIRQERIGRALGSLDPLEPRRVDGSGDEDEDGDASGSSHSGFPSPADFQSSFFTAESLQGEDVEGEGPDLAEDDSDLDSSPSPSPPGAQRRGGGVRGRPPRYLGGIPTPVVRRIEQQQQQRREEDRRRRAEARSDRGLWADEDHGEGASAESPSRTDGDEAARLSLSSSSPRTADADAAGVAIRSAPSQSDSERDRRAIQSVLYCRGIVRLRSEASPDWTVGSAAAAAAAARSPLPSLAAARAHLSLGEALLGVHDYPEACKSFQSAYRIFSAHAAGQRDGERRHALSLALCMERMGTATAMLAASAPQDADPDAAGPSSSSTSLLGRSYTVHLEAFRLRCLHLGPHHVDAVASLNMIAKLHALNNDWPEAQRCLWQVYWARARAFGELHPSCAVSAHDVANVFCHLGLWDDASNFYSVASHAYDTLELPATNPAVRKLRRDMERLERLQQRQVYNDALR